MFRITNTSESCYSVYFNYDGTPVDGSAQVLIREDDFEDYTVASDSEPEGWAAGAGGAVCTASATVDVRTLSDGTLGIGVDSVAGNQCYGYLSPTTFGDHTIVYEMNNTNEYSISSIQTRFTDSGTDGYDYQFRDSPDTFEYNIDRYDSA